MDDGGEAIRAVYHLPYRRIVTQMVAGRDNPSNTDDAWVRRLALVYALGELRTQVRFAAALHGIARPSIAPIAPIAYEVPIPGRTSKTRPALARTQMTDRLSNPPEADHV